MDTEILQNFINDWLVGVQEIADSIAPDPDADNSMLSLASLPYRFDTYAYASYSTNRISDGYDRASYGWGLQDWLCKFRVTLYNNSLVIPTVNFMGRHHGDSWQWFTNAEIELLQGKFEEILNKGFEVINNYPTSNILIKYTSPRIITFQPALHSESDITVKAPIKNNDYLYTTKTGVNFQYSDSPVTEEDGTITVNYGSVTASNGWQISSKGYVLMVLDSDADAYNLVSNVFSLTSSNNDIINYTKAGSEYKLYYGDNYLIFALSSANIYNFTDLFSGTKDAADNYNTWFPDSTPIHTPTYDECKYGPEPPEPSELVSDNQEDGGNYNHAEFTKVYACTSAELNDLYQWMGGGAAGSSGTSPVTVPDSFDPMNRIVGLIGYPMVIDVGVGDQTTFTFRNAANQTINTGWSTYKYGNFDRAFDFGTVDIPNWEEVNNGAPFLDYSATVEIYIPFCGVVGLDPQAVMGCTLSCKMWIDFLTGDCSAVVYTNYGGEDAQHPVAFVSGNCGSAEVVSANAFGAYQGAKAQASHKMSQAILGGFKDLATSVISGATTGFTRGAANPSGTGGNAGMRAGAIGSVIGGAMNLGVNLTLQNMDNRYAVQVAKNALGTTISGSFGQQTSWYYMDTPYIKVTWPTPISKDVELYGKTFGVPVHRSGALSEFTGYTVCNNVDVSGIAGATASELAIIKQFLETGVFIKEGGEE